MLPYFCLYIYSTISAFSIDLLRRRKKSKVGTIPLEVFYATLFFIIIPLGMFMGLRYGIGTDFFSYSYEFQKIHNNLGKYVSYFEPGYWLINTGIAFFTENPQWLFLVTSFVIVCGYILGFLKSASNITVSISMFFGLGYYFYSMNIIRQYMAIAIIFSGIHYLEEKKYKKFSVFMLMASMFHASCLVLVPFMYAVNKFKTRNFYIFSLLFFIFFRYIIFNIILKLVFPLFGRISVYFSDKTFFTSTRISFYNVGLAGAVFLIYLLFGKYLRKRNYNNINRAKYVWIMLLAYLFLSVLGDMTIRVFLYFTIFLILLVQDFVSCFTVRSQFFVTFLFTLLMFLGVFVNLSSEGTQVGHYIPYVTGIKYLFD